LAGSASPRRPAWPGSPRQPGRRHPRPGIPSAPDPTRRAARRSPTSSNSAIASLATARRSRGDWNLFGPGEAAELVALAKTVDLVVYGQASRDYARAERVPPGGHRDRLRPADAGDALCRECRRGRAARADRLDSTRRRRGPCTTRCRCLGKAETVTVMTVRAREAHFERDRRGSTASSAISNGTASPPMRRRPCRATCRCRTSCCRAPPISMST